MTTQCLLTEWLDVYQKERIKLRTYKRYQDLIQMHILPFFGEREITTLKRQEIWEFLTQQKRNGNLNSGEALSSVSTNMMLGILKLAFAYACDVGYLAENPCVHVKRSKSESKTIEAFTVSEQRALENEIADSDDPRLHGILLCLYTGLRIGELLGLTWEDVNTERGVLSVSKTVYRGKDENGIRCLIVDTPKTKTSARLIPLPAYITEMLKTDQKNARSPYVVENKKGERMAIRSYQYLFKSLTKRANVRTLNFHALRHTFATRAIECGMDVRTVADVMGHRNVSVTLNRYAHCMLDHKMQMMQKLPRVL